jgi:pimeloyl-ACP methyl ester carboxylesterase
VKEKAVFFGKTATMVGIITDPPEEQASAGLPAFLLLNSGMVPRFGPNRVYVKLAMGFVVLRFDFSGIGDSGIRGDALSFAEYAISETQEAMDFLCTHRGVHRFVLAGLCSGALVSLRAASCDSRVIGVVPVNLAGHKSTNAIGQAHALIRHYWRIAFRSSFSSKTWQKVTSGSIDYARFIAAVRSRIANIAVHQKVHKPEQNPFAVLFRGLIERGTSIALIHSEGDEGLDYTYLVLGKDLHQWISEGKLELLIIPGANHTFTLLENQEDFLKTVQKWAQALRGKLTPSFELGIGHEEGTRT